MPIRSSTPIMLKTLSVFPEIRSPIAAPDRASGKMVRTVTGLRNELNWLARTMYATRMPIARAKNSPPVVSAS
jgi:hypothetical protein